MLVVLMNQNFLQMIKNWWLFVHKSSVHTLLHCVTIWSTPEMFILCEEVWTRQRVQHQIFEPIRDWSDSLRILKRFKFCFDGSCFQGDQSFVFALRRY